MLCPRRMLHSMTSQAGTSMASRWQGRGQVAEAMTLIALARVARACVPMRRWSGVFGSVRPVPPEWSAESTQLLPNRASSAQEAAVSWAVHRGSRWLPGTPNCLAQAAAAQVMLRRRGSSGVVVIGLRRDSEGAWDAHAWLLGRRGALVGGPAAEGFKPTMVFAVASGLEPDEVMLNPGG